jgi:hypothetical protein
MDHLPKSYIDETYGIRPGPEQGSFNNVIYSTWYIFARKLKGTLTQKDIDLYKHHLDVNADENGLYSPKNSHDNLTYKVIGSMLLGLDYHKNMSFFHTIKHIGFYRVWDVISYAYVYGNSLVKFLLTPFLVIPALQIIEAVSNEGKVRPDWIESGDKEHLGRLKWWFSGKKLVKLEQTSNKTIKTWKLPNGELRSSFHMQNDGKHLAIFRLYVLREESFIFKVTAFICDKIFKAKYGKDYTYKVVQRYFDDQNHPLIKEWEGIDGIL